MAKAIDIGTSFIVGAKLENGKEIFTIERDAFFSMPREDFAEEMLHDAGAKYLLSGIASSSPGLSTPRAIGRR